MEVKYRKKDKLLMDVNDALSLTKLNKLEIKNRWPFDSPHTASRVTIIRMPIPIQIFS